MSTTKNNPIYRCTQAVLYAACGIILRSFARQLDVFYSKKALYNNAYLIATTAEIEAALLMPEHRVRVAAYSLFRIKLAQAKDNCVMHWKLLRSYIFTAYAEEYVVYKAQSAGVGHLEGARKENWKEVSLLMIAGLNFIRENETLLEANDNMPVNFMNEFIESMDHFESVYADFTTAREEAREKTHAKTAASNAIYRKILGIARDGQLYFADNDALKSEFVFENILRIMGRSKAGLKGVVSGVQEQVQEGHPQGGHPQEVPVQGAEISLYADNIVGEADYITQSDEKGNYDFGVVASGCYRMKMECEGFVTKVERVEILVGVTSSKKVVLVRSKG